MHMHLGKTDKQEHRSPLIYREEEVINAVC